MNGTQYEIFTHHSHSFLAQIFASGSGFKILSVPVNVKDHFLQPYRLADLAI